MLSKICWLPILSILTLVCALHNPSMAQGCCSGGAPLSGSFDLGVSQAQHISLRLTYDYNHLSDVIIGTKKINDQTRTRLTNAILLRSSYAINKKFGFGFIMPYVQQVERIESITTNETKGAGLGDVIIFGQYKIINKKNIELSYALGIKAPTGVTNEISEITKLPLSPELQPGTGAWDWFNTIEIELTQILKSKFNIKARVSHRLNGDALRFNQLSYRFGNELQSYLGTSYNFFFRSLRLSPQLTFFYRNTIPDQTNGFDVPNTSGHWLYLIPGLNTSLNPNLHIGFFTEIPLYRNLTGVQLTTSYKMTISISYNFSIAKTKKLEPFIFNQTGDSN